MVGRVEKARQDAQLARTLDAKYVKVSRAQPGPELIPRLGVEGGRRVVSKWPLALLTTPRAPST